MLASVPTRNDVHYLTAKNPQGTSETLSPIPLALPYWRKLHSQEPAGGY